MKDERQPITVCKLGNMPYEPAWSLQKKLRDRLVRAKRAEPKENIPHVLLIVDHPPVFTLGKSGDRTNLLADQERMKKEGATFVAIDRGGDITYHGPGQLVGYPILDLDRFYTDIHRYLRELEEVIIRTCADYGLEAGRIDGRTGVWIRADERGKERKICAMGIHTSRWVTMHGFAFNLNTQLEHFDMIVPCGISDRGVTSLANELNAEVDEEEAAIRLLKHFRSVFRVDLTILEREEAEGFLTSYLSEKVIIDQPCDDPAI